MLACQVSNIKKSFGADLVFENITFAIQSGERIGLVGPNGSGKTTLLKMLIGQETALAGEITFQKGASVGYLEQIPDFGDAMLVETILREAKQEVFDIKEAMDAVTEKLSSISADALDTWLEKYSQLHHAFEQKDGYLVETAINKVCTGLKITDAMRACPFTILSGGEKTRVMLARILLENPSILLLDEPSNHLDLTSIEWLEGYLKDYQGTVLVVSHDRYFLDHVCQKIVELSQQRAQVYHGNYSYYVLDRERRFLLELKAYSVQEKQTQRIEEQIKRYRLWGTMRDSEKMFKRAKELEKRLEKIERLDKPVKDQPRLKLSKTGESRSGKRVLDAFPIDQVFAKRRLFQEAHIELIQQDRLAILGPNGSGKTTLLKILLSDYAKKEPLFKWGSQLNIGYLPQQIDFEDDRLTVIDYFTAKHRINQAVARRELAKALFVRDDVFKPIYALSGGEKSKLKLCSLTYAQANLLILDEPTNHLDIDSREVLEDMLLAFKGTLLFVSHDRYFIKKIATRVGEIHHAKVQVYEGDFTYYQRVKNTVQDDKGQIKIPKN